MKNILILFFILASHGCGAETQLFSNYPNPEFEVNRDFIEKVHKRFNFDSTVLSFFIERTKGEISKSSGTEFACIEKLGGPTNFGLDLFVSNKHDEQLGMFFIASDGPRKAKEFSGIFLGALNEKERSELLAFPANSLMVNRLVGTYFTLFMLEMHPSAFKRVAAFFFAAHCPR